MAATVLDELTHMSYKINSIKESLRTMRKINVPQTEILRLERELQKLSEDREYLESIVAKQH